MLLVVVVVVVASAVVVVVDKGNLMRAFPGEVNFRSIVLNNFCKIYFW